MYCPACGYQTASAHVRFCPGCGFRLDGVTDLLARSGEPAGLEAQKSSMLSERQKGLRLGVKLILLSVVTIPVFLGLSVLFDSPGPLVPAVVMFLAGAAWSLYSALFGNDNPYPKPQAQIQSPPREFFLQGRQNVPNTDPILQRPSAPEPVHPPSVTERTTNLLKDE